MTLPLAYRLWTSATEAHDSHIALYLNILPYCSVPQRKAALALTRIQQFGPGTRYEKAYGYVLDQYVCYHQDGLEGLHRNEMRIREVVRPLLPLFLSPLSAGFLSMVTRNAPFYTYDSVLEERQAKIEKELSASQTLYHPERLDYTSIFSKDSRDRNIPLASNMDPHPETSAFFHSTLKATIPILRKTLFFPQLSEKTIGRDAQRRCRHAVQNLGMCSIRDPRTIVDIERVYHETGVVLEGPVELRCAWKYNDLSPRVYYARGPTCFKDSKYAQAIWNILVDSNPTCHRLDRYNPPIVKILAMFDRMFIYDFKSFTSFLYELRRMTRRLATFFRGIKIKVLDTWLGVVDIDLGEYLDRYNQTCNIDGLFDIARLMMEDPVPCLFRHMTGMLGIPGNISSCTWLHGVHLACVLNDYRRAKTVGDDAFGIKSYSSREERDTKWLDTMRQVQNIGLVAEEKFELWDYEDDPETSQWHYIKRPMVRLYEAISSGRLETWPSLANILGLSDEYHTDHPLPLPSRRIKAIKQWSRLLSRIALRPESIDDVDRQTLLYFQTEMRVHLGIPPAAGGLCVKLKGNSEPLTIPPPYSLEQFGEPWTARAVEMERHKHAWVDLPAYGYPGDHINGVLGESFRSQSSRILGLLEKLGYLKRGPIVEERIDLDFLISFPEVCDMYVKRAYTFSYTWYVEQDFPSWYEDAVSSYAHVPHEIDTLAHNDGSDTDDELDTYDMFCS